MRTMTKAKAAEKDEAIKELREILPRGATVYVIVRDVARSGMSRTMDLYTIPFTHAGFKPGLRYLTGLAAKALGYSQAKDGAIRVGGCGMDMTFAIVYDLAMSLFDGDGYALEREAL